MNDFEILKSRAKLENKPMMLVFSGSDWCSWCIKLENEVLSQPEFKDWAKDNVLLFKIDFPQYHPQPPEEKKQNSELAGQYGVNAFPTVILLNADGSELARTGYQHGGASNYIAMLKTTLGK